jgi:hypothetical protein
MEVTKNRSERTACLHCGEHIPYGEVSVRLGTKYYYHGCASFYLHLRCLEPYAKKLLSLRKENAIKILKWKLEGNAKKEYI